MADFQAIVLKSGVISSVGDDTLTANTIDSSTPTGVLSIGSANAAIIEIGGPAAAAVAISIGAGTDLAELTLGTGLAAAGSIDIGGGTNTDLNLLTTRVTVSGVLTAEGNLTVEGSLRVEGTETIVGTTEFEDEVLFKGPVVFGDDTGSNDTVEFAANTRVVSNIYFDGTGTNRTIGLAGNDGTDLILQGSGIGGSVRLRPQGGNTYFGNYQGVAEDSYQLIIDGNDTQDGAGLRYNPVEERWEARTDGEPWEVLAVGDPIPAGTARQILQNNGTAWVAVDTSALDASANYVFAPADGTGARSMTVRGQNSATAAGGGAFLLGGTTNAEGAINGGAVTVSGGVATSGAGNGGAVSVTGGAGADGGGYISLLGGEAQGVSAGGGVFLAAGSGNAGGGGAVTIASGYGANVYGAAGAGGPITITSGGGATGGAITIEGGDATEGTGPGGHINITAGNGRATGDGGHGGNVTITSGTSGNVAGDVYIRSYGNVYVGDEDTDTLYLGNGNGNSIAVREANVSFHANARIITHLNFLYDSEGTRVIRVAARAGLPGGALAVTAGDGSLGGTLELTGGHSEGTGDGGDVLIYGGSSASSGVGGTVRVTGGAHGGTGTAGDVVLGDATTNTANVYVGNDTNGIRYGMTAQRLEAIGTGSINIDTTNSRLEINGTAVSGTGVTASNFNALFDGSTVTSHTHAGLAASGVDVPVAVDGATANDVVYVAASDTITVARANALTTSRALGVKTAANTVRIGGVATVGIEGTLVVAAGDDLYLSAAENGKVTNVAPASGFLTYVGQAKTGATGPATCTMYVRCERPIAL